MQIKLDSTVNAIVRLAALTPNLLLHKTLQGCVAVRWWVATLLEIKGKRCVYMNDDRKFLGHYFVWYFISSSLGYAV